MNLQFWGAAQTVTGSMHLVEVGGRKLLLDCGLYQGRRKEAFERNRQLPFDAAEIDAVVLSHAHIDHSGNLPSLVGAGFTGSIFSTSATRDLCAYMLVDSAHIQENDVRYVNKRRKKQGKKLFEPLYTKADAVETLTRFQTVDYDRSFEPIPGVVIRFRDAGHILGSAVVVLDAKENGRNSRLVFSGDIGRKGLPILRDPQVVEGADYVIMESTYGDRLHDTSGDASDVLRESVAETIDRNGILMIPAFAVGRTQEIVYRMNEMCGNGELPEVDFFVDSPLAVNATDVFRLHPECWDRDYVEMALSESDRDPLSFSRLSYLRAAEESIKLNERKEPAVIIAASGMCEGGRVLHHLKHHATRRESMVLFVSFQAAHTLGRRILEGKNPVSIYGVETDMRAEIREAGGYSAHADRKGLLRWASRVQSDGDVKHIFLVHGEQEGMTALAAGLEEQGASGVKMPVRGEKFSL